tara:strand:+ start:2486 stop:3478 length:993 start_codon:yes stop_codon:yes gene_type:complete
MKTLIEKYLSGKSSADEQRQLLHWMRQGDHLKGFRTVKQQWESDAFHGETPEISKEAWSSLQGILLQQTQRRLQRSTRYLRVFQYAAIFLVIVFIAAVSARLVGVNQGRETRYNTVQADAGQIARVVLPDQTEVWLNSGSSIKYSNDFAFSDRNVELVGEAYFSVTKNPDQPLIVSGSDIQVRVLGTKFNVSAYSEDKNFSVTLEEGSVELISDRYKNFSKKIEPGELAVFNKEHKTYLVEKVNVELYTSWKEGMIHIYNLPLEEVVKKLEKRYNQKFQLDDEVKRLRYTYTIKNETLSDILRLMETITPIDVIQEGEVISLKYNKNKLK